MKANELRIGNYVHDNFDVHNPMLVSKIELSDFVAISNGVNCYQPIPLTEEILLKCGFYDSNEEVNGFKKYTSDEHFEFDIYLDKNNNCCIHYLNVAISKQPKGLHEIQNIIQDLTGEELNFNL